uniref:Uncharacterized protein n=1 Tax=Opuntia streptacantha TaxID=393608 RepID=A0A7C9AV72_OPUST
MKFQTKLHRQFQSILVIIHDHNISKHANPWMNSQAWAYVHKGYQNHLSVMHPRSWQNESEITRNLGFGSMEIAIFYDFSIHDISWHNNWPNHKQRKYGNG